MNKILLRTSLVVFILLLYFYGYAQTLQVAGKISTLTQPVKYASITFIDQSDTSKKYTTITDTSGNYQISIITSVEEKPIAVPAKIELEQNYPNPFSSTTAISYTIKTSKDVKITIFDILGREVKNYSVGYQSIGKHGVMWDGINNVGDKVATGVYFYRLQAEHETIIRKMVFMGNNTKIELPMANNISREMKKYSDYPMTLGAVASRSYTIQIQNAVWTKPKILITQFSDVTVEHDTTLNFQVQEGIMAFSLCYQRQDSVTFHGIYPYLIWTNYLNNITGSNKKAIINRPRGSESRGWSPDGKYIIINYEDSLGIGRLYLYDTANDSLIKDLVPSPGDTVESGGNMWTPDGRIIYGEKNLLEPIPGRSYIMNLDGTNKKLLKYDPIFFYLDNYNYLLYNAISPHRLVVFHSNLDGTVLDTLVDLTQFVTSSSGGVSIYDFNPNTGELLLGFDDPSTTLPNMVAKYNISENRLDTIMVSDSGWKCYRPKFSNDFKKIAITEVNIADTVNLTRRISILDLENHTKTTLVEFTHRDETGKPQGFDTSPMAFSSDDKYLAYSKSVIQSKPSEYIWGISYLYVVELEKKQVTLIDIGIYPQWNPRKPH